jgi:hypothetical protein
MLRDSRAGAREKFLDRGIHRALRLLPPFIVLARIPNPHAKHLPDEFRPAHCLALSRLRTACHNPDFPIARTTPGRRSRPVPHIEESRYRRLVTDADAIQATLPCRPDDSVGCTRTETRIRIDGRLNTDHLPLPFGIARIRLICADWIGRDTIAFFRH